MSFQKEKRQKKSELQRRREKEERRKGAERELKRRLNFRGDEKSAKDIRLFLIPMSAELN
jgi:hypothetical protein